MADGGTSAPLAPQPPQSGHLYHQDNCLHFQCKPIQPAYVPQLNWSHFKPEFAGKPDEDAEVHLLRMNHWMDMHAFQEGVRVQYFC